MGVTYLPGVDPDAMTGDIDPEPVLKAAIDHGLQSVFVLGTDKDGEFYAASSIWTKADILFLLEKFKHEVFEGRIYID